MSDQISEKTGIKTSNKKKRIIIGVIVGIIVLFGAVAAVILHFIFLPQVQVVDAFVNTMSTAKESEIDKKYGGYDMIGGVFHGNYDFEVEDENLQVGVRRSKDDHQFLLFADVDLVDADKVGIDVQFYVDDETSVLYAFDKSIQIDYADDIEDKISNSVFSLIGLNLENLQTGAGIYVDLMEALAGTAEKDSNVFDRLFERTKDVFLGLESEKLDKETFVVNGKNVRCQVYQITFNAKDMAEYIEDCYEISFSTGEKINDIVESVTGYTLDELFDIANDEAEQMRDLHLYFAVNSKQQLVSIYCENVTDKQIDMELNFLGGDYLCDEVEFHMQDAAGNEVFVRKDDISKGDSLAMEYTYKKRTADGDVQERTFTYFFENDEIRVETDLFGEEGVQVYSLKITGYEKGKYIELQNDAGMIYYIGTEVKDIQNPVQKENLNLFDTNIIRVYSFFSDFLGNE